MDFSIKYKFCLPANHKSLKEIMLNHLTFITEEISINIYETDKLVTRHYILWNIVNL